MKLEAAKLAAAETVALQSCIIRNKLLARAERIKRVIDILITVPALFCLLPLFLAVIIAIKLDSRGPILFRQLRGGRSGRPFRIFKFRTMVVLEDGNAVVQARRGDERVTRVGQWLRWTSIDELPQLLNVLRGEMSLVGPRPHALAHDDYYSKHIQEYQSRYSMLPGITGWAQINGARGATPEIADMRNRVKLDLWYVNHWSVLLDLKILITTAIQILVRPNGW